MNKTTNQGWVGLRVDDDELLGRLVLHMSRDRGWVVVVDDSVNDETAVVIGEAEPIGDYFAHLERHPAALVGLQSHFGAANWIENGRFTIFIHANHLLIFANCNANVVVS